MAGRYHCGQLPCLEGDIVEIVGEAERLWLYPDAALQASKKANNARDTIKDQQGFIVVKHRIVVGKASIIAHIVECFQNGNTRSQDARCHLGL